MVTPSALPLPRLRLRGLRPLDGASAWDAFLWGGEILGWERGLSAVSGTAGLSEPAGGSVLGVLGVSLGNRLDSLRITGRRMKRASDKVGWRSSLI